MSEIENDIYWNIRRTLTHNCLINVIVGNRGGGKTYGSKEWAIDNWLNNKEQFGYIRRYRDDLKEPMMRYFDDIKDNYPEYEFKTDSKYFYMRLKPENPKEKWTEKDIIGFGFTLSTANNRKSIAYPKITTLIFDEFLIDKGSQRYLNNEVIALLNLYETVARPGTDHPRVTLFLLANAISITNPYFLFWDLKMPTKQDGNGKWIWKHPNKSILVEDVRNEKFIDKKRNTEFGGIIRGTSYEAYSIDNKFLLDDPTFIEPKSQKASYFFTMIYMGHKLGVWISRREGRIYVSKKIDPSHPITYTLTLEDHKPNTMFFKNKYKAERFKMFIDNYKLGNVRFESMNIKNLCYEIIKLNSL